MAGDDRENASLRTDVAKIDARVTSLEGVIHNMDVKLDRWMQSQTQAAASKPTAMLDAVRTGMSILQGAAFLVGCTVAAIVYVSSNANNADIAVMKYQISELRQTVGTSWRLSGPPNVRRD
jgi:hypothetical protein